MSGGTETVSVVTRTVNGRDSDGNTTYSETLTVVPGAIFNPGSSVELIQGQDILTIQPTVYLPDMNIGYVDAIDIDGARYEVDGSPNNWTGPYTGRVWPVEVRLRRATG
jgi:hypothetical protein